MLLCELNRIHSHLVWLGTSALDLGAMSMFFYCFRDRDRILDLFEMSTGQRMHTRYFQVGGVFEDIPSGFDAKVREFCHTMPKRVDQFLDLLGKNEIVLQRPFLYVDVTAGATDDLTAIDSVPASPGTAAAELDIRRVRITDGTAIYRDTANATAVSLTGITQTLKLSGSVTSGALTRVAASGELAIGDIEVDPVHRADAVHRDREAQREHRVRFQRPCDRGAQIVPVAFQ